MYVSEKNPFKVYMLSIEFMEKKKKSQKQQKQTIPKNIIPIRGRRRKS